MTAAGAEPEIRLAGGNVSGAVLAGGTVRRATGPLHDAVAGFRHPGPWRYFPVEHPVLICHNDIASYNACFDGDEVAGVFGWDLAGPSTPRQELAFMAWNFVPASI